MFEKKDIIYSETIGVCRVDDITKLTQKKGETIAYYVLRSMENKDKVAYIPVDKHIVNLRNLIDYEEAKEMQSKLTKDDSNLKKFEINFVINNYEKVK
ncbi:MAG: CarD-like/TRCF domain protein [Lachnospiraceae bacterium]|nr:CarD-like/TRCF domain protein [Lachnospiraceae bacterium]